MVESEDLRPKRRWTTFSTRMLLFLIAAMAVWLSWLVPRVQEQARVVDWARRSGVTVSYAYQLDSKGNFSNAMSPPVPKWLINLIGVDYFSSIVMLNIENSSVRDISMISSLGNLRECRVSACEITDLSPFKNLTNLQRLTIRFCPVSDLGPISGMKNLRHLSLFNTEVTDVSAIRELTRLESISMGKIENIDLSPLRRHPSLVSIDISRSKIENASALKTITTLKSLNVEGAAISTIQIREIGNALPNCVIQR